MFDVASINEIAESWRVYVWHAGWQGTLVAGVILAVVYGLRRAPSPLRYGLLLVALFKFAMPPLLTVPTGLFSHLPAQVAETAPVVSSVEPVASEPLSRMTVAPEPSPSSSHYIASAMSDAPEPLSANAWFMLIHTMGIGLFGAWLALMFWRLLRRAAGASLLTEGPVYDQFKHLAQALGVRRPVRLLLSDRTATPMAFGIWDPAVLLPRHFVHDLRVDQLQTVLAHELGHHRRWDLCFNYLQLLILAVWWFNPLVWLLNWVLRRVREDCCDDLVLGLELTTQLTYSETLIKVAAHLPKRSHLAASLGFAETYHPLTQRIKRIVDAARPRPVRLSLLGAGLVLLVSATLLPGLDSVQTQAQANPDATPKSELKEMVHETVSDATDQSPKGPMSVSEPLETQGDQTTEFDRLRGQVLHGTDKSPITGAIVHILKRGQAWRLANQKNTKTNKQGQYAFNNLEPGEYHIWATHGDWVSRWKRNKARIVKSTGDESIAESVILHLHEGCVLRVRALSSITNQPLAQARVDLTWPDIGNDFPANENGLITIPCLTQGSWQYEVTAPGHGRVIRTANLQRGMKNTFDIRLPAGGILAGVVTDQTNRGIEGVGVHLYLAGNSPLFAYVKTDQDGAYRLPHVPINMSVDVRYHCDTFFSASKHKIVLTESNQVQTVNVQLKKPPLGGSVTGVVTNQENQPVQNARVIFHANSSRGTRRVKTNESGRFRMDDIPDRPGSMILTIRAKGYSPQNIDIEPGTAQTPQDLSIRLIPGHMIAGKVVDETRQPISRVHVSAGDRRFLRRWGGSTTTNRDGHFAFDSLPSHIGYFSFAYDGYSDIDKKSLTLDRDDHVIVLRELDLGVIEGKVVDAESGVPIPLFNLRTNPSGDEYDGPFWRPRDFSSEKGRFYLRDLTTGAQYMLCVKAPGFAVQVYDGIVAQSASRNEPSF